ncbi:MAG: hypothetical protein ACTSRU_16720 [Candidatus Hodarchaeales archaeon]
MVMRLLVDHPKLIGEIISVDYMKGIILDEYHKEVDKRQIGRALKTIGFYQENINVVESPIIRRKSVYHLNHGIFDAARLKYVVKDKKED